MCKIAFFISIVFLLAIAFAFGDTYYYGDDGPITLIESDSIITVKLYPQYEFHDWNMLVRNFDALEGTITPKKGVLGYNIYF